MKTPSAAPEGDDFNDQWTTRSVVAPEFVTYKSADGAEIEAALLRPTGSVRLQPASVQLSRHPFGRPRPRRSDRPMVAMPSSRGGSCSSRAATRCSTPTSAARPATASNSSR